MKRFNDYLILIITGAVFGLPILLMMFGFRAPAIENTAPPSPPEVRRVADITSDFVEDLTTWIRQTVPGRDKAVGAVSQIALSLGESTDPRVLVGTDGWLFYSATVDEGCLPPGSAEQVAENVHKLRTAYAEAGKRLVFVIAPNKASIHSERLPESAPCVEANWRALDDALAAGTNRDAVRLWRPLREAKATTNVYLTSDTHWNEIGAAVAVREVVNALSPGIWDTDAISFETQPARADLRAMLGLDSPHGEAPLAVVSRKGIAWSVVERGVVDDDLPVPYSRSQGTTDGTAALIAGRTILLHDSFGFDFLKLAPSYFEDLTAARSLETMYPLVADLIRDGDTIILFTVQRNVTELFGSPDYEQFLTPLLGDDGA